MTQVGGGSATRTRVLPASVAPDVTYVAHVEAGIHPRGRLVVLETAPMRSVVSAIEMGDDPSGRGPARPLTVLWTEEETLESFVPSPDGRWVAYIVQEASPVGSGQQLVVRELAPDAQRQVLASIGAEEAAEFEGGPVWSHRSTGLAFGTRRCEPESTGTPDRDGGCDWTLRLVALEGQAVQVAYQLAADERSSWFDVLLWRDCCGPHVTIALGSERSRELELLRLEPVGEDLHHRVTERASVESGREQVSASSGGSWLLVLESLADGAVASAFASHSLERFSVTRAGEGAQPGRPLVADNGVAAWREMVADGAGSFETVLHMASLMEDSHAAVGGGEPVDRAPPAADRSRGPDANREWQPAAISPEGVLLAKDETAGPADERWWLLAMASRQPGSDPDSSGAGEPRLEGAPATDFGLHLPYDAELVCWRPSQGEH